MPVLHDPREVTRLEVGQRGEVAVAKREAVIVVADVQGLAHALRVAVHKTEVAVVGAAPDARRLQHDAQRHPLWPFDVVLDLLPRRQPGLEYELVIRGQELPVEKVLEGTAVNSEQLGAWDELKGRTQRFGRDRLYANHC